MSHVARATQLRNAARQYENAAPADDDSPDEGFSDEVIAEVLGESGNAAAVVLEAAICAARTGDIAYLQRHYQRVAYPILKGVVE